MRILFCRSNPIAPDPRVEKEARALAGDGHQVAVLGWDRSGELPEREEDADFQVFRLRIKAGYANGIGNLPQLLKWELGLMRWLIVHRKEYDAIHACDFDTILPCLFAKWLFKKKVIYDIFDFYADHLRRTPQIIIRIIRSVDLWAIGQADAVIIVDDARVKQIEDSSPRKLIVVYNSPEDQPAVEYEENFFSPSSKLKLTYVGLLQVERGLFEMLAVLKKHPEWELNLAGFGGDEQQLVDMASDMPNVNWHGRVAYPKALQLSRAADVLFATYDPSIPNHAYSSPNKIFEAMMLGKPLIVAHDTNIDSIVERHHNGLVVEYGNVQELENALSLLTDSAQRELMGGNSRRAYDDEYGWGKMKDKLSALYREAARPSG